MAAETKDAQLAPVTPSSFGGVLPYYAQQEDTVHPDLQKLDTILQRFDHKYAAMPATQRMELLQQQVVPQVAQLHAEYNAPRSPLESLTAGFGAEFNPADYSAPRQHDSVESIGRMLGGFSGGVGATLAGAGVGSIFPGPGTAIGAAAGGVGYGAASGARAEARQALQKLKPVEPVKQLVGGAVEGASNLVPIAGNTGGLLRRLAATALKSGAVSGASTAASDLLTGDGADANRILGAAAVGAGAGGAGELVGHVLKGRIANQAEANPEIPQKTNVEDAPQEAGYAPTANGENVSTEKHDAAPVVEDAKGNHNSEGAPESQGGNLPSTTANGFDDFLSPHRKGYYGDPITEHNRSRLSSEEQQLYAEDTNPSKRSLDFVRMQKDAYAAADTLAKDGAETAFQRMTTYLKTQPNLSTTEEKIFSHLVARRLDEKYRGDVPARVGIELMKLRDIQLSEPAQILSARGYAGRPYASAEAVISKPVEDSLPTAQELDDLVHTANEIINNNRPEKKPPAERKPGRPGGLKKPKLKVSDLEKKIKAYIKRSKVPRKVKKQSLYTRLNEVLNSGHEIDADTIKYIIRDELHDALWDDGSKKHVIDLFHQYEKADNPADRLRAMARLDVEISKKQKFSFSNFAGTLAKVGWVSQPQTQIGNAISQYAYAAYQRLTDVSRVITDAAHSAKSGQPRQYFLNKSNRPEVVAQVKAKVPSLGGELRNMVEDLRYGGDSRATRGEFDTYARGVTNSKILGAPFRLHNFFSGLIDRPIAREFAELRFSTRLEGLVRAGLELTPERVDKAYAQSILDAQTVVFQNKGFVAKTYLDMRKALGNLGRRVPGGSGLLLGVLIENTAAPFAAIGGNLTEAAIRETPIPFLKLLLSERARNPIAPEEKAQFVDLIANACTGTAAMALLVPMALGGAIQGLYKPSENQELRKARIQSGEQELAVNLSATARAMAGGWWNMHEWAQRPGDVTQTINFLSPLKQKLLATNAIVQAMESGHDPGTQAMLGFLSVLTADDTNSGFFAQVRRAYDYRDPETGDKAPDLGALSMLASTAGSTATLPFLRAAAQALDPTPPNVAGLPWHEQATAAFRSNVPGLRNQLPNRKNVYGEDILPESPWWLPGRQMRIKSEKDDAAKAEILRLGELTNGKTIPKPFWKREPVLDENETQVLDAKGKALMQTIPAQKRDAALGVQGQIYLKLMDRAVRTPWYHRLPDKIKVSLASRLLSDSRKAAAVFVLGKTPEFISSTGKQSVPSEVMLLKNPDAYWVDRVQSKYLLSVVKSEVAAQKKEANGPLNRMLTRRVLKQIQ